MTSVAKASRIALIKPSYIHTQSMRLASGHEALVTRVLAEDGRAGFGFNFQLDATEARHMAMYNVGLWPERPHVAPVMAHPWETAWVANQPIPWEIEPGFSRLEWLP
jgi:hypothetical protein